MTTAPEPPSAESPSPAPVPPTATTWIEATVAGTVNGFDPDLKVWVQVTICPDWMHPAGTAASAAAANTPNPASTVTPDIKLLVTAGPI